MRLNRFEQLSSLHRPTFFGNSALSEQFSRNDGFFANQFLRLINLCLHTTPHPDNHLHSYVFS